MRISPGVGEAYHGYCVRQGINPHDTTIRDFWNLWAIAAAARTTRDKSGLPALHARLPVSAIIWAASISRMYRYPLVTRFSQWKSRPPIRIVIPSEDLNSLPAERVSLLGLLTPL